MVIGFFLIFLSYYVHYISESFDQSSSIYLKEGERRRQTDRQTDGRTEKEYFVSSGIRFESVHKDLIQTREFTLISIFFHSMLYYFQSEWLFCRHSSLSLYQVVAWMCHWSIYPLQCNIGGMLFVYLSIYLSIYPSIHPSIHLSACLSVCLPIYIYLPIYISVFLLSICLSIYVASPVLFLSFHHTHIINFTCLLFLTGFYLSLSLLRYISPSFWAFSFSSSSSFLSLFSLFIYLSLLSFHSLFHSILSFFFFFSS